MDWRILSPYLLPLLIAALLVRRAMRTQKPKRVRFTRLWLFPALLLLVTIPSLVHEPAPGLAVIAATIAACLAGGATGWFRVHTLEFTLDSESGKVSMRATQLGALLIVGLIGLRYGADLALKKLGWDTGVYASNATLVFATSMLVARSIHTWIRARALLTASRTRTVATSAGTPRESR
jgi:hypothetical protein